MNLLQGSHPSMSCFDPVYAIKDIKYKPMGPCRSKLQSHSSEKKNAGLAGPLGHLSVREI